MALAVRMMRQAISPRLAIKRVWSAAGILALVPGDFFHPRGRALLDEGASALPPLSRQRACKNARRRIERGPQRLAPRRAHKVLGGSQRRGGAAQALVEGCRALGGETCGPVHNLVDEIAPE